MELLTEHNLHEKVISNNERLIIQNRTRNFLLPILGTLPSSYVKEINKFYSIAVGLADEKYYPYLEEPSLLLLKNIKVSRIESFQESLKVLEQHRLFVKDYIFADAIDSWLHMFVIRLPEEYHETYKYFIQGQYSKMYSEVQKARFFTPNRTRHNWRIKKKVRDVLDRNPAVRTELEIKLNVTIPENAELESKLDFNYEVFNYHEGNFVSVNQKQLEFKNYD